MSKLLAEYEVTVRVFQDSNVLFYASTPEGVIWIEEVFDGEWVYDADERPGFMVSGLRVRTEERS